MVALFNFTLTSFNEGGWSIVFQYKEYYFSHAFWNYSDAYFGKFVKRIDHTVFTNFNVYIENAKETSKFKIVALHIIMQ